MTIKLALIGVVVACLVAPISAPAGHVSSCPLASPKRSGGISEMASCGNAGLKGNRAEFVKAINRPVEIR
jgi:hypothetical protein